MPCLKKDYIISTLKIREVDSQAARRAIEAVQEAVRVSRRVNTSKVDRAKAAYIKAIDDAVIKFGTSK